MLKSDGAVPKLKPGGLVTVAFLKANTDERGDHLSLFMPIALDVIAGCDLPHFTVQDVQSGLSSRHGIEMPQQVITTLLRRAEREGAIKHSNGRYERGPRFPKSAEIGLQKQLIADEQSRLADAFLEYARSRDLRIDSRDSALSILLNFVERSHVAMVLQDSESVLNDARELSLQEVVAAEFFQSVAANDVGLRSTVNSLLQGLVLYYATFIPNFQDIQRSLRNLYAYFDTRLVLQALGYEGPAAEALMNDTLALLRTEGVQLVIFDDTVDEIRRIIQRYASRWDTWSGRRSLPEMAMKRYLELSKASRADIVEMDALLEPNIKKLGLRIRTRPPLDKRYLLDEKRLSEMLADRNTKDTNDPRVQHDVNCTTAILMLRKDRTSTHLAEIGAAFATDSVMVLRNTTDWYVRESKDDLGVPPAIHVRALATMAWLRHPTISSDLKLRDLLATCAAALRPKPKTWDRFCEYLERLVDNNSISSDEMVAIFTSSLSNGLLKEAEIGSPADSDVDAETMQEIVHRVQATYKGEYAQELDDARARADAAAARADAIEREAIAEKTTRISRLRSRHLRWARNVADVAFTALGLAIIAGIVIVFQLPSVPSGYKVLVSALGLIALAFNIIVNVKDLLHFRSWVLTRTASVLDRLFEVS